MSEIRRFTITHEQIRSSQSQIPNIQHFFSSLGWAPTQKNIAVPSALQKLLQWRNIESLLFRAQKHAFLMIISPLFVFSYGVQEGGIFIWLLLPLAIPICILGGCILFAFRTNWFAQKLQLLEHGFVALIGSDLIENLPQHRFLLQEQSRLQRLLSQVQHKRSELQTVHKRLIEKSKELNEDSSALLLSMEEEKHHLEKAQNEVATLLRTISQNLEDFEQQRAMILKRAELEYIRSQARALSQEEQTRFSQRALADLEIDALFLQQSIHDVEDELGKHGVHFSMENELSR